MAPTTEGEIYDDDIMAERAPRQPNILERYAEAAEATDARERERDRLARLLKEAQAKLEESIDYEATLRQELRQELQNREMR